MEKSGQDEIRIHITWAPTSALFLKLLCIFLNNGPADFFSRELTHHQNKEKLFFQICMMDVGSDKMFLPPMHLDLLLTPAWDTQIFPSRGMEIIVAHTPMESSEMN